MERIKNPILESKLGTQIKLKSNLENFSFSGYLIAEAPGMYCIYSLEEDLVKRVGVPRDVFFHNGNLYTTREDIAHFKVLIDKKGTLDYNISQDLIDKFTKNKEVLN